MEVYGFVYARRHCQCMFYWLFTAHKYMYNMCINNSESNCVNAFPPFCVWRANSSRQPQFSGVQTDRFQGNAGLKRNKAFVCYQNALSNVSLILFSTKWLMDKTGSPCRALYRKGFNLKASKTSNKIFPCHVIPNEEKIISIHQLTASARRHFCTISGGKNCRILKWQPCLDSLLGRGWNEISQIHNPPSVSYQWKSIQHEHELMVQLSAELINI